MVCNRTEGHLRQGIERGAKNLVRKHPIKYQNRIHISCAPRVHTCRGCLRRDKMMSLLLSLKISLSDYEKLERVAKYNHESIDKFVLDALLKELHRCKG